MDLKLLEKYFRNECTKEEVQEVLRWMSATEKEAVLKILEKEWGNFDENSVEENHEAGKILNSIHARLADPPDHLNSGNEKEITSLSRTEYSIKPASFYFLKVAAILFLAFALSFVVGQLDTQQVPSPVVNILIRTNPAGQKTTFRLPDGTQVTLNAQSTLTYPEVFSDTARQISLQGEAFFEVTEDKARPFTVVANSIATTALGTSFNIKAYSGEDVSIALASGKVRVQPDGPTPANEYTFYLSPGEELTYHEAKKQFSKGTFDANELAWKEGVLQFQNAGFEKVVQELERWYGVEFILHGKLPRKWNFSGQFKNENLENVLLSISYSQAFDFEIENDQVNINFK